MKKIENKLEECCLNCEHFDPSGCVGIIPTVFCSGEPDRMIACGHMAVCKRYLEYNSRKKMWKRVYLPNFGIQTAYICPECEVICAYEQDCCPNCKIPLLKHEEKEIEIDYGWIVIDCTPDYDIDDPNYSEVKTIRDIYYKCPKCGLETKERTKFCKNCGSMNIKDES